MTRVSEDHRPRRPSRLGRRAGALPRDERLSQVAHALGGHVLTLRLLLKSLSASASAGQQEALRLLGELAGFQDVLARELRALSHLPGKGRRARKVAR